MTRPPFIREQKMMNKVLIRMRFINGFFLAISFVAVFATYKSCDICKGDYRIPSFSELHQVQGSYVSFHTYKNITYGGILIKNQLNPVPCGFLKKELIGAPAIGWFDSYGNIYQLEVSDELVCKYQNIVERKGDYKHLALISIICFLVFGVSQVILWKIPTKI